MRKYRTAKELSKFAKRGRYSVGENVYLQISEWGTRAWVFRYVRDGKARHVGLGPYDLLTLAEARDRGHAMRRQLLDGIDPLEAKRAAKRGQKLASARSKTFKQVALEYIAQHEGTWRGDRSRQQWTNSLTQHAFPHLGDMPIAEIDVAAVLSVLDPITRTVPETAARVRHRIAAILDFAAARDLRAHDNPARRPKLLPKRKRTVRHFPAMAYTAMPDFVQQLGSRPEPSARALEFLILTCARPGEVLGMKWQEVDLAAGVWTVPGERMKSGREHRVPLSSRCIELLAALPRTSEYVFPGRRTGVKPYPMTFVHLLRKMGHSVTAHGFRASFKTWASERTAFPRELIEAALAHVVGDAAEQAYSRGDMLAKRRQLMEAWSEYCSRPHVEAAEVVALRKS
jgi:integrase